jgi:hypothetical protein
LARGLGSPNFAIEGYFLTQLVEKETIKQKSDEIGPAILPGLVADPIHNRVWAITGGER